MITSFNGYLGTRGMIVCVAGILWACEQVNMD